MNPAFYMRNDLSPERVNEVLDGRRKDAPPKQPACLDVCRECGLAFGAHLLSCSQASKTEGL